MLAVTSSLSLHYTWRAVLGAHTCGTAICSGAAIPLQRWRQNTPSTHAFALIYTPQAVLGGDHVSRPRAAGLDIGALQRTEAYLWGLQAQHLHAQHGAAAALAAAAALGLPLKLLYATVLADYGQARCCVPMSRLLLP